MKKILLAFAVLAGLSAAAQSTFTVGDLKYTVTGTNTVEVAGAASSDVMSIDVPSTVENEGTTYDVTAIGESAFRWSKITSAVIPSSVKVIKYNAGDRDTAIRYAEIADAIGLCGKTRAAKVGKLIDFCLDFNREMNIPNCISEYGEGGKKVPAGEGFVSKEEFEKKLSDIAANALLDACTGSNPRAIGQAQMEKMLIASYYDEDVYF